MWAWPLLGMAGAIVAHACVLGRGRCGTGGGFPGQWWGLTAGQVGEGISRLWDCGLCWETEAGDELRTLPYMWEV